jgi:hypothetical protein
MQRRKAVSVASQIHGGIGFTWLKFGTTMELAREARRINAYRAGATALDRAAMQSV